MSRSFRLLSLLLVIVMLIGACATPAAPAGEVVQVEVTREVEVPGTTITFWSTETQPERAAKTQVILDRFEADSGIKVILVLTDEDQLPNLLTAGAAAGTLPDVMFFPMDYAIGWAEQGILNTDAATTAINDLGADTFAQGPLNMVKYEDNYAAVPSDGWGQLLIYRADMFAEAGLAAPDSFATIEAAAAALNDPANNFYGITAATDPGAVFTQQTWEQFALANDCQLVDDAGDVTLDSPACTNAIDFYANLMNNYSPPGVQDVVSTRATYFAGQASMIVWSPFILDEMAGLRDNAFPTCPECADDPAYLAKNSAIVPAFIGPDGTQPAQYGQVSYLGISANADVAAATEFIKFWLSDGYADWLAVSPEGKFPMRQGNADDANAYIDEWKTLETGVDRKAKLSEYYSDDVIDALIKGAGSFNRWGFVQGKGSLVTAVYESLVVPRALRDVMDGAMTAAEAATEIQAEVMDLNQ